MTVGWRRCGRSSASSCQRPRRGCWRSAAARWAAWSRRWWMAATRRSGSTHKPRRGRTTNGSRSSSTSPSSRWTAWWSSGPGSASTRPPPGGGFARLAPPAPGAEPGWLHKHQQRWSASGRSWDHYLRDWATKERLHPGETILGGLETRFTREHAADAPYLFADLADTSQTEEHDRLRPDPALRPARPHPRPRQCALRPGRGHPPAGGVRTTRRSAVGAAS